jgi:hypothetical protein
MPLQFMTCICNKYVSLLRLKTYTRIFTYVREELLTVKVILRRKFQMQE